MQEAIEDTLYDTKVGLVFSGHVHSYERICQVYQYKCTAGAPYYSNIGDGGNKEGLASEWVEPQPEWSWRIKCCKFNSYIISMASK
jgi:hypothetical protein